jgi:CheY-like chemotaxis protein
MSCILLVEDNEMNRDMLSRRLTRRGYRVIEAMDGKAGVDKAHRERPDLILMDVSLPEMDGWEATRMLKASSDTGGIPIIIITAHATMEDREKSLQAGCDEYESKPVDLARLLKKIEALLGASAQ